MEVEDPTGALEHNCNVAALQLFEKYGCTRLRWKMKAGLSEGERMQPRSVEHAIIPISDITRLECVVPDFTTAVTADEHDNEWKRLRQNAIDEDMKRFKKEERARTAKIRRRVEGGMKVEQAADEVGKTRPRLNLETATITQDFSKPRMFTNPYRRYTSPS